MSPEPTSTPSPVAPGVAFAVERFEWTSRERIELVGRWSGLRGHRFLRPTLDVQVDGERRRMLADLEHKPWAPENGQDWVAAFKWTGRARRLRRGRAHREPGPRGAASGARRLRGARRGAGRDPG